MAMPAEMEVITKAKITDKKSGGELTTIIVGVYPEEGRKYTGLNVLWLIERTERCSTEEDIPNWKQTLSNLLHNTAVRTFDRFSESSNARDLEIVITLYHKVAILTPTSHPDYPEIIATLASYIEDRYKHFGNVADLDHVIELLRTLLSEWMDPPFPPLGVWYYGYLADTLCVRYAVVRRDEDVEEVLALRRKVLELTPSPVADHAKALQGVAQALAQRYRIHGKEKDMDDAIQLKRTVFRLASSTFDAAQHTAYIHELAEFIFARFGKVAQRQDDVKEMIELYEQLLQRGQAQHSEANWEIIHRHLASVINERFRRTGNADDLDRAISLQLQALEISGPDHPKRHVSLALLGQMLRSQFILTGDRKSLDEAINCVREALQLVPHPHLDRPMVLDNLSIILRRAFEEYDQYHFLREAIELEEEALKLPPTTQENRLSSLSNLAACRWAQYHRTGGIDLDDIISLYEKALDQTPERHPSYPFLAGNLGTLVGIRLDKKHDLTRDDLTKSITLIRVSLAAFDELHPENSTMSMNLGVACFRMYNLTRNSDDLKEGVTAFRHAANHPSAPISQKFRSAKVWAVMAEEVDDSSALEAYHTAIQLLPFLVAVNADLEARHQRLKSSLAHTDGLGVSAAACALRAGMVENAIQFLEEGRAVFWNQALKLRSPIRDLELAHPELGERFQSISKKLEISSFNTRQHDSASNGISVLSTHYQDSVELGRLKAEWDAVLGEIRQQRDFADFLQRPRSTYSALQKLEHSLDGPVVMLCITDRSSGAIIMTENEKRYLELPGISLREVLKLVKLMRCVGAWGRSRDSDSADDMMKEVYSEVPELEAILADDTSRAAAPLGPKPPSSSSVLRHVLRELWMKIGLPVVQFLQLKKSESPLRVYWCPTGPSTFLPIHAAGLYDINDSVTSSESLLDYMVSSYVPTVGALIDASQDRLREDGLQQKVLAIVQPKSLPFALDELDKIKSRLEPDSKPHLDRTLVNLGDNPSNPATISSVLHHLSTSSIVHFACHGKQISGNPLDSALILEDGGLTLSRIMQAEMKYARLAFLCACDTAMGEKEVPDESMHIGGALLFSGFRGVVATMWSIADIDGPKIADEFYGCLVDEKDGIRKEGSRLNTNKAARALHNSVLKLRASGVPLQRWVPFVYLGK